MKTDARTRYTKKVIKESFFELLKENPLNKITVKSICDKSEINRTTFYRYYSDPFDLMEKIESELIDSFRLYTRDAEYKNLTQIVDGMMDAVKLNQDIYTLLISDNGDVTFINRILSSSYELFKDDLKGLVPRLSPKQQEWFYYYIAQGCISVVINWIQDGMKEDSSEVSDFIVKLDTLLIEGIKN